MTYTISGKCHCNNLSYDLSTRTPPEGVRAQACDCSFCRLHGAKSWSDPEGSVIIRIADKENLQKYRFGLRTADFYICRICGTYVGATLSNDDNLRSTVNLRISGLNASEETVSYAGEDVVERVERRKRTWTPTTIIGGA